MKFTFNTLLLLILVHISGCAYLIHGEKQELEVVTTPPGLVARIDMVQCMTPCVMPNVPRKAEKINILYEGVEKEFFLTKTLNLGAELLNIFNYGIGTAIDFPSGAAKTIEPVNIDLTFYSAKNNSSLNLIQKDNQHD